MGGFKQFLLRGNVVDMAVGIVIGAAFGSVVTAFLKDLLTPMIAAIVGKPDFSAITFEIHHSNFPVRDFINPILSFILIATAVYYFVVLPFYIVGDEGCGEGGADAFWSTFLGDAIFFRTKSLACSRVRPNRNYDVPQELVAMSRMDTGNGIVPKANAGASSGLLFEGRAVTPSHRELDVTFASFLRQETMTWRELFEGFETLRAVTYSTSASFIRDLFDCV